MLPPHLANFGLDPEGTFDRASAPAHDLSVLRALFGGRGQISYEALPVPFAVAVGLRRSLAAALERVDRAIADADPDWLADDLA